MAGPLSAPTGLRSRRRTRTYDQPDLNDLMPWLTQELTPIGTIIARLSGADPGAGWLLLDGAEVQKADYPDLYALLSAEMTLTETEETFTLPDLTGQYLIGRGAGQEPGTALGSNDMTLTLAQLPPHDHPVADPGHAHTASQGAHSHTFTPDPHTHTVIDPGHAHETDRAVSALAAAGPDVASLSLGNTESQVTGITLEETSAGGTIGPSPAGDVTVDAQTTGITVGSQGGGAVIDKRPASVAVYYFVKGSS